MTPDEFKAWRLELGLSQRRAAEELGVSHQTVLNYDRGFRHGDKKPIEIPEKIALACETLKVRSRQRNAKKTWRPATNEQLSYIEGYLSERGVQYKPLKNLTLDRKFYCDRIDEIIRWIRKFIIHGYSMHAVPGQYEEEKGFFVFRFDSHDEGFNFAMAWGGTPSKVEHSADDHGSL